MRKLDENDLRTLYNLLKAKFELNSEKYKNFIGFVNQYYPKEAVSITIVVNSEYNDYRYDNEVGYVEVSDAKGNLLRPLPQFIEKARHEMKNLSLHDTGFGETEDYMNDIVVPIKIQPIPTLYMED